MLLLVLLRLLALLPPPTVHPAPPTKPRIEAVDRPATTTRNAHYVSNRAPLAPQAFVKLPIGSVQPGGWLRENIVRQADGLAGTWARSACGSPRKTTPG